MIMFPDHEARKQKMRDEGRGDVIDAHDHCADHGEELARSNMAGCFYCCAVFRVAEILDWLTPTPDGAEVDIEDKPEPTSTALCPRCGIDSVIGDASGFPVTDKHFLQEMNGFWFS